MGSEINILDPAYREWFGQLCERYRTQQVKAAVRVNQEMLRFYWDIGHDLVQLHAEERWGQRVLGCLSADLQTVFPNKKGFSPRSLYYCKRFYLLYNELFEILPQVVAKLEEHLFSLPWGHHRTIIDKCGDNPNKAIYYVHESLQEGWSRAVLSNAIAAETYERRGKAITNFKQTLPTATCDLAQELTRDPYNFAFTGLREPYNERLLKDALLNNITRFLTELGTGFAYVGKEYRIEVGETENFIDLLFYNLQLSCFVVVEVKIGKFTFADVGQLSGYVVACNHQLRKAGRDNPTIGLLICKEKDRVQAQYALESSSQPIGISEYELEKFYPEKVIGTIPSIEELESLLSTHEV